MMEGVLYSRLPFYAFLLRPACGIAFHGRVALFVLGAFSLPSHSICRFHLRP